MLKIFKEAESKNLELDDQFKYWHQKMSGQAYSYGKNPSRGNRAKQRNKMLKGY